MGDEYMIQRAAREERDAMRAFASDRMRELEVTPHDGGPVSGAIAAFSEMLRWLADRESPESEMRLSAARTRSSRGPQARPWTAEECEIEMRRLTNGERGCANPAEHRRQGQGLSRQPGTPGGLARSSLCA